MMDRPAPPTIAELLRHAQSGSTAASVEIYVHIKEELRTHLPKDQPLQQSLSPKTLIQKAYQNLVNADETEDEYRLLFVAIASTAMRRLLGKHTPSQAAPLRDGARSIPSLAAVRKALERNSATAEMRAETLAAFNEVLDRLAARHARQVQVVECWLFGGMTFQETATALGVSRSTVRRDWASAEDWLNREMAGENCSRSES